MILNLETGEWEENISTERGPTEKEKTVPVMHAPSLALVEVEIEKVVPQEIPFIDFDEV